jgi:hypothetical protein
MYVSPVAHIFLVEISRNNKGCRAIIKIIIKIIIIIIIITGS